MTRTLLADADFLIEDCDSVLTGASIFLEGDTILAVGARSDLLEHGTADREIDCRGLILLPGLVNAHTHLFQVLTRGLGKSWRVRQWAEHVTYPVARRLSGEEFYVAALLGCADAVRNGATAIIDHPTQYARFHADESCRAMDAIGVRGAVARGGADQSLVDPGEIRAVEEELDQIVAFIERGRAARRVRGWVGPSGFHTCTPAALQRYKAVADELDTKFHMHLAESAEGKRDAQAAGHPGEASWALALGLLDTNTSVAHGVQIEDGELDALAASGAQIVHCPTSNQILGSGIAPIVAMRAKGLPIALASDGASSNDSLDMIAELKAATLIHRAAGRDARATSARDMLEAATVGGARVLGIETLGCLRPGYKADVVGVQIGGNPSLTPCLDPIAALAFYASGRDVALTMVDGQVLYWRGTFPTIDIDGLLREVNAIVGRQVAGQVTR